MKEGRGTWGKEVGKKKEAEEEGVRRERGKEGRGGGCEGVKRMWSNGHRRPAITNTLTLCCPWREYRIYPITGPLRINAYLE